MHLLPTLRMDYAKVVRQYESKKNVISLMAGSPGPETLKDCRDMLLKATNFMLDTETDLTGTFSYGSDRGCVDFRSELAKFLTHEYGSAVDSGHLMVTAGATQALHMVASVLFSKDSLVFMEDPSYFAANRMFTEDLQMTVIPVPCDSDGMDTDTLSQLLQKHRPAETKLTDRRPFWAMVYTIPVYNNPTGRCYKPERCQRLVELARQHDVLLLAEDVYNLIHFEESVVPPQRLLAYDNPSDADFRGHTISSGTFSKILAPGLRLGWVEAHDRILNLLYNSNMMWSGGSLNHYASKLAEAAIKLGLEEKHLTRVRNIYKKRMDAVCAALTECLPNGATFTKPQGGFFVWIEFPVSTDTFEMMKWTVDKYKVSFMPGICFSSQGKCGSCMRISIAYLEEEALVAAVRTLCQGAKEYLQLPDNNNA